MFIIKVKKIRVINEINDISVEVECYLTCPDGAIYKNKDGGDIKTFKVRVSKSMLSEEFSFEDKLIEVARTIIRQEFHVSAQVVSPQYREFFSPYLLDGTPILMLREDDVKQICVGMTLVGPGYNLDMSPLVESITKKKEIILDTNLHFVVEGCAPDPKIIVNADIWAGMNTVVVVGLSDYPQEMFAGMAISGKGIPPNTYIKQFDQSTNTLHLTQDFLSSRTNAELILSKNPFSKYLYVNDNLIMDERYAGLSVIGRGMKDTIKTVTTDISKDDFFASPLEDSNCIKLSDNVVKGFCQE